MSERTIWTDVSADVPVTEEIRVEQYNELRGRKPAWYPRWEFDSIEEARAKVAEYSYNPDATFRIVRREVGPWISVPVTP